MNQEILDRIDALAIKLGTTAEYLWPKLVGHAQVTAMSGVGGNLVGLLLVAITATLVQRKIAMMATDGYNADDKNFLTVVVLILTIGAVIGCISGIVAYLPGYYFPEATALKGILG